ncbi:MAG: 4Fe-4S dicluster domain-containing protein [Lachnospirales bacterium]
MENITDINQIKMSVLKKTAEYTFNGQLNEKWEDIPYELTDPIKPSFRCCVYREREIIRQRVRLAMGRLPSDLHYEKVDQTQIVHVIKSACEGCPIDRVTVTSNCRNCLAKKCMKACKFDAIIHTPQGAYIDKTKCKNCGACAKACPYNAIVDIVRPCIKACPVDAVKIDENDLAMIDETRCINCGQCVIGCPFGAIAAESMITNVINCVVTNPEHTYAMIAPSIEGQFGTATVPQLKTAIKKLGFKDCYEVALGGDAVAWREAEELIENVEKGKKMTTSCCPAFYNLVMKHYPEVMDNVSTTGSPMIASAKAIKAMDPDATVVFIGPCIAKKNEVVSRYMIDIGAAVTFDELEAIFEVKGVNPEECEPDVELATRYGKGFAKSGGVSTAVLKVVEEKGIENKPKVRACNGAAECKVALQLLKMGRLPEDIIEGMACEGGCVNGPMRRYDLIDSRKVFDKNVKVENTEIINTCVENGYENINIHFPRR